MPWDGVTPHTSLFTHNFVLAREKMALGLAISALVGASSAFTAATPPLQCAPLAGGCSFSPIVPPPTRSRLRGAVAADSRAMPAPSRGVQREPLIAKGFAGILLLRFAYQSALSAAMAIVLGFVTVVSPVAAIEAVLLAGLLCLLGTASYWPANIFVFALAIGGGAGCANGCLMWWERRRDAALHGGRRRRRNRKARVQRQPSFDASVPEDDSAGLLALTIGAITASIVGALP